MADAKQANQAWIDLDADIMKKSPSIPILMERKPLLVGPNIAGAYGHPVWTGTVDYGSVGLKDPRRARAEDAETPYTMTTTASGAAPRRPVPYRDFQLEYPPGALPVFVAPALLERFDYRKVFQLLMAACLVGAVLASFAIAGPWAAVLTAVAPLALGSVVLSRFDLWPAALTVLALAAALRRYWAVSAVLIGTAFAAKLWPAVLIPLVAIWIARSEGGRAAGRWLGIAAGTAAAWFLPFVILSPGGVAHSFHAQFARPLQLESLGASLLITWHHVIGTPLFVESSYGSQNLIGPGTHAMAIVTSVVGVLALAAIYVAFARRHVGGRRSPALRRRRGRGHARVRQGLLAAVPHLAVPLVPLVRGRRGSGRARSSSGARADTAVVPGEVLAARELPCARPVAGAARAQPRGRRARGRAPARARARRARGTSRPRRSARARTGTDRVTTRRGG